MRRIRFVVSQAATDCACQTHVDEAVDQFISLEQSRQARRLVMEARGHLEIIVGLTDMLSDLGDISWNEIDRSVFAELAHLFDDVARSAALGSLALRMIPQDAPGS